MASSKKGDRIPWARVQHEKVADLVQPVRVGGIQGGDPGEFVKRLIPVSPAGKEGAQRVVVSPVFRGVQDRRAQPFHHFMNLGGVSYPLQVFEAFECRVGEGVAPRPPGKHGQAIEGLFEADIEVGGLLKGTQGLLFPSGCLQGATQIEGQGRVAGEQLHCPATRVDGCPGPLAPEVQLGEAPIYRRPVRLQVEGPFNPD